MTLDEIKQGLRKMDPTFDESDETNQAQIVMLAALEVGQSQKRLRLFTGIDSALIAKFAHNLRKSGIWANGKVYANWWQEEGRTAFLCDTLVALGFLERTDERIDDD